MYRPQYFVPKSYKWIMLQYTYWETIHQSISSNFKIVPPSLSLSLFLWIKPPWPIQLLLEKIFTFHHHHHRWLCKGSIQWGTGTTSLLNLLGGCSMQWWFHFQIWLYHFIKSFLACLFTMECVDQFVFFTYQFEEKERKRGALTWNWKIMMKLGTN